MPKFAANLTMLFAEVPFLERFKLASQAGFEYIEFLFPYDYKADQLANLLAENNLQQILFNMPPGYWEDGERGIACLPSRKEEFRAGVHKAIDYAKTLGVRQVNCLAGLRPDNVPLTVLHDTLCENICYAAEQLQNNNMTLLLEPINSRIDMPGFFLDTLDKTIKIIHDVGCSNVKIQFDIYHMQVMQGDIIKSIENNLSYIGHIQFADCPGRHEPGTGELNFENIFTSLDKLNYLGWVSAEYISKTQTAASLAWFKTEY